MRLQHHVVFVYWMMRLMEYGKNNNGGNDIKWH